MCGRFGVPFATFFCATFLGKSVFKCNIQVQHQDLTLGAFHHNYIFERNNAMAAVLRNRISAVAKIISINICRQSSILWRRP
jgi:hypothetical protein